MEQIELPGMEALVNYQDFRSRLEYANYSSNAIQLERFYKDVFPGVVSVKKITDKKKQRQGIDTALIMISGKVYYFDEKIRSRDYDDILLEEWSVWCGYPLLGGRKFGEKEKVTKDLMHLLKVGWLGGNKLTDYISYVMKPSRKVYFLPFLLLQRAWKRNYFTWLATYGRVSTITTDKKTRVYLYHTTNIPVPVDVLFEALYATAQWEKRTSSG